MREGDVHDWSPPRPRFLARTTAPMMATRIRMETASKGSRYFWNRSAARDSVLPGGVRDGGRRGHGRLERVQRGPEDAEQARAQQHRHEHPRRLSLRRVTSGRDPAA